MDLTYLDKMPIDEFIARRERVFTQMQDNSVLVVFTETEKRRNSDCDFLFRPDSYFWYLSGLAEPQAVLILLKKAQQCRSIIFLRQKDPLRETWNGRRLGLEAALSTLAVDEAFDIEQFQSVFAQLCENLTACYYARGVQPWGDSLVFGAFDAMRAIRKNPPLTLIDWQPMLSEMRVIKSENEIALLQQACQISALAHLRAMRETRPNRYEFEIEGEIQYEFSRRGARFASYNQIVAGGDNACILHYNENDQVLKEGELVLIDSGAEFAMYAGDITRTFPVSGKFSQAQREIYQLVLKAMKAAIELLVPQSSLKIANDKVIEIFTEGLVELGILQGEVVSLIENQAYKAFYMHGLGHYLGLDVHDVGELGSARDRPLEVGMVITVEPGLYIPISADVPEQYKGIGIRIEDDLLITDYGNKNLTSAVPKEIAEIEALMAESRV